MEGYRLVMGRATNSVTTTMRWAQVLPLALIAVFFGAPILTMLARYLRPSSIINTLTNSSLAQVWWFTTWQATASTALTVVIGLPLTWAVSRYHFIGSRLVVGIITVPFFLPAVVVATGVRAITPDTPILSILWAHVVFNIAVVVRVVGSRWSLLAHVMEDTAADLGATPLRIFRTISLPHIRGALRNATAIIFLFCFTSFSVIAILGGPSRRTIESEVFTQAVSLGNTQTAISLSVLQALVVIIVFVIGTRHTTDENNTPSEISTTHRAVPRTMRTLVSILVGLPLMIVAAPLLAVVVRSLVTNGQISIQSYRWLFDGTTESIGINIPRVLWTSIAFATVCSLITTMGAIIIASARNRTRRVAALTALPLMVSAVTVGVGIIVTFNQAPFDWRAERWLLPVVHSVIALPLAVRVLDPAVRTLPHSLGDTAADLGAGPWRVWRRIHLPVLRPAISRAAGLSGAVSLGEFGATSFLTRSDSTTIPIAIQRLLGQPGTTLHQSAYALATLCVVFFTLAFASTEK